MIWKSKLPFSPLLIPVMALLGLWMNAQAKPPSSAGHQEPPLVQPADLARMLQSKTSPTPLIIQVGFRVLYEQAHIPGSEYIGPTQSPEALESLRKRVSPLAHDAPIILYCGCCPWTRCPNVHPAYQALRKLGFTNVKVLYLAQDFGTDWVNKGYPVQKAQ